MAEPRRGLLAAAALAVPLIIFLAAYLPAVGHGFIADDFRWIVENRVTRSADVVEMFSRNTGFYRPMSALSFAADFASFGNRPLAFGLTNVALAIGCGALLFGLLRELKLPREAAAFGVLVWLLNFHGVSMAMLWISGRTALILTAAALATAIAVVRGRALFAALFLLVALCSKEEAVALPITLLVWLIALGRDGSGSRRVRPIAWTAVSCAALAIYGFLRTRSGAMTPASAPWFYRFTFAPADVAGNFVQYADRTFTFAAGVCLLGLIVLQPAWRRVQVSTPVIVCGLAWAAGGYALTLFLPVRSSLYACFPSIGAAIIAAEIGRAFWQASVEAARQRAMIAAIVMAIALLPVYRARNHRWTDLADFSTSILGQLRTLTASLPDGAHIVLVDDRRTRVNLGSAFGVMINDAVRLDTGRRLDIWVDAPQADAWEAVPPRPCADCVTLTLVVRNGILGVDPATR
jgi:hypothetical protein